MGNARLNALDGQRFDPSRRHTQQIIPNFDHPYKETMGLVLSALTSLPQPNSVNERVGGVWDDYDAVPVDLVSSGTSTLASSENGTTTDSTPASLSLSDSSLASSALTLDDSSLVQRTEVYDREDFIITRTVVMPTPKHPILGYLPFSSPRSPFSRPSSPLLQALNCFNNIGAFEENMGYGQSDKKYLHGRADIEVVITETYQQSEAQRRPLHRTSHDEEPQVELEGYPEVVAKS